MKEKPILENIGSLFVGANSYLALISPIQLKGIPTRLCMRYEKGSLISFGSRVEDWKLLGLFLFSGAKVV